MSERSALIAGATGLIGGHVLDILLSNPAYGKVITLGRNKPERIHTRLISLTGNFNKPGEVLDGHRIDDIYCCLGTTMKKAGSRPAFFKVDFEYVVSLAEYGLDNGARHFMLVSSSGANAKSSNFYLRVKGEVENTLKVLNYRSMHVMRPSLLLGERGESRPGEKFAELLLKALRPVMVGPLVKFRPIEARSVAAAMVYIASNDIPGVFFYESDEVDGIGRIYLEKQITGQVIGL